MRENRLLRPLAIAVGCRLLVTVLMFGAASIASAYGDDIARGRPWPDPGLSSPTLSALAAWDGAWYGAIAEGGYPEEIANVHAFFPGYPALIRAVSLTTGMATAAAGALVAALAAIAAGVAVWLLSARLGDEEFADRATLLVMLAPGAFVLSMVYAEGLMLAASAASLLFVHRGQWVLAGVAGAVATAARPNAAALVVALGVAAGIAYRRNRALMPLAAVGISLVGMAGHVLFLWLRTGTPVAWLESQRSLWDERLSVMTPVRRAASTVEQIVGSGDRDWNAVVTSAGLVLTVVGIVYLCKWKPPLPVTAFALGVIALSAFSSNLGMRPRFVMTAFPLAQAIAWRFQGPAFAAILAASTAALTLLATVTVTTTLVTP